MNKNLRYVTQIVVVLFLVIFTTELFAERIGVKIIRQEKSLWCWAASSEMIIEFYGKTITQTDIVKEIKGSVVNQAGSRNDMIKALAMGKVTGTSNNQLEESKIKELADAKEPFIVGFKWSSGGGHALAYDGYEGDQFYINDPMKNNPSVFTYNSLKTAGGKGNWSMSIATKCDPTGIEIVDIDKQTVNPMSYFKTNDDKIVFIFNNKKQNAGIIKIYNVKGVEIHSLAFSSDATRYQWNKQRIGDNSVHPGIYFAELRFKFVISNHKRQLLKINIL